MHAIKDNIKESKQLFPRWVVIKLFFAHLNLQGGKKGRRHYYLKLQTLRSLNLKRVLILRTFQYQDIQSITSLHPNFTVIESAVPGRNGWFYYDKVWYASNWPAIYYWFYVWHVKLLVILIPQYHHFKINLNGRDCAKKYFISYILKEP